MRYSFSHIIVLTGFVPLVLFLSCSDGRSAKTEAEVTFVVEDKYLSEPYQSEHLGFQFSPPRDWNPVPSALVKRIIEETDPPEADFVLVPETGFFHDKNGSTCIISAVENGGDQNALEAYILLLKEALAEDDIVQSSFSVDAYKVTQLRLVNPQSVSFILLLRDQAGSLIQIDYIIPANAYESEIIKIESSIGSIQKL